MRRSARHRRLRLPCLVGTTVLTVAAALAVPAVAAEAAARPAATSWTLDSQLTVGTVNYTLLGHLTHRPGNAHSGQIWFDTSDDEDSAVLYDWHCPPGVVPPLYYDAAHPSSSCRILSSLDVDEGTQRLFPQADVRLTLARESAVHPVHDELAGRYLPQTVTSQYTLRGVGPVTQSVDTSTPGVKDVTKTRAAQATGRFAWIHFADPRLRVSGVQLLGDWIYVPATG